MEWPTFVTIVDDLRNAELVERFLADISWVTQSPDFFLAEVAKGLLGTEDLTAAVIKSRLEDIPQVAKDLAESRPKYFKDITTFIHIRTDNDVEAALQRLQTAGPSIAFIDFNYGAALGSAHARLSREYMTISQEWKQASEAGPEVGGCVFSAAFEPTIQPALRVLCPTTNYPPQE